jgi:serine/threonine protein kinase
VKIADFGIAALRDSVDPLAKTSTPDETPKTPELTQTGAFMGTPLYMAPELWRGADRANEATDVFSLGLIAYVLLAKKYPWDAPPIYDVGAGRSVASPPAPEGAPEKVVEIIARALSLDPAKRPTASEFAAVVRST